MISIRANIAERINRKVFLVEILYSDFFQGFLFKADNVRQLGDKKNNEALNYVYQIVGSAIKDGWNKRNSFKNSQAKFEAKAIAEKVATDPNVITVGAVDEILTPVGPASPRLSFQFKVTIN